MVIINHKEWIKTILKAGPGPVDFRAAITLPRRYNESDKNTAWHRPCKIELMRVLLVGTSYPSGPDDWKGRFIKDLVHALAARDALDLRLWAPPGEIPENVVNILTADESEWLHRMLASGGIAHLLRTEGWKASGTVVKLLRLLRRGYRRSGDVDLFHVSWLQNAIPLWGIDKPAVISVLGTDFALLNRPGWCPCFGRHSDGEKRSSRQTQDGWLNFSKNGLAILRKSAPFPSASISPGLRCGEKTPGDPESGSSFSG